MSSRSSRVASVAAQAQIEPEIATDWFATSPSQNFGAHGRRGMRARFYRMSEAGSEGPWRALRQLLSEAVESTPPQDCALLCLGPDHAKWIAGPLAERLHCIGPCRGEAAPYGFFDANLDDPVAIDSLEHEALRHQRLVVVAGVLEWLHDPRPLLRMLRRWLKQQPGSRAVFATFARGQGKGVPVADNVFRLWTRAEFAAFLEQGGFEVIQRDQPTGPVTLTEVTCSTVSYAAFLACHGLPAASPRLALVDTDRVNPAIADGLAFIRHLERITAPPPVVMSVLARRDQIPRDWVRAEDFAFWSDAWRTPIGVLNAVQQLLFLYDDVLEVIYPDAGGLFCRVSQAKRAGLLPPSVTCVALCQGNSAYAERRRGSFDSPDRNLTHVWEKITLELADRVVFPTESVRAFYLESLGLRPLGTALERRLPFAFAAEAPSLGLRPIDTIALIGLNDGRSRWEEAGRALEQLLRGGGSAARQVRRVILVGRPHTAALPLLPAHIALEQLDGAVEMPALLASLAPHGLALILGGAGGHPYLVLEAVEAECAFLAMSGAGSEDLIPPGLRDSATVAGQAAAIAPRLQQVLLATPQARASLAAKLREEARAQQAPVNDAWQAPLSAAPARPESVALEPVTVVIPIYNRPFREILDAVEGLINQTWPPREVIFVDDASEEDFAAAHAHALDALLPMKTRYVRHWRNLGLSAARNTGLAACETPLLCVHDTDNIAGNDFLYRGCLALSRNPALDAVTFLAATFRDGEDWTRFDGQRDTYYPLGDGIVASLAHINWFGDAMGVYRSQALRDLGGWDETSRAMWEDMALFTVLVVQGRHMMTIPSYQLFYRIRPDSMLRTESEFDARQRLVRCLKGGLSVFDGLCLQRVVLAHGYTSRTDPNRALPYLRAAVRVLIQDHPRLQRAARALARALRRLRAALRARRG